MQIDQCEKAEHSTNQQTVFNGFSYFEWKENHIKGGDPEKDHSNQVRSANENGVLIKVEMYVKCFCNVLGQQGIIVENVCRDVGS